MTLSNSMAPRAEPLNAEWPRMVGMMGNQSCRLPAYLARLGRNDFSRTLLGTNCLSSNALLQVSRPIESEQFIVMPGPESTFDSRIHFGMGFSVCKRIFTMFHSVFGCGIENPISLSHTLLARIVQTVSCAGVCVKLRICKIAATCLALFHGSKVMHFQLNGQHTPWGPCKIPKESSCDCYS